jgi:trehalose 6-phosphate phosphatase
VTNVLAAALEVLSHKPAGLLTDVDGTISAIAPTPSDAYVSSEFRDTLSRLARYLDIVAAVSGRAARDVQAMVSVPEMTYVGNHGMEQLHGNEVRRSPEVEKYRPHLDETLEALRRDLTGIRGVLIEDKGSSASIHFRLAESPDQTGDIIRQHVSRLVGPLRVTEGKMVIELRPPVNVTKGTAVRALIAERGLRGVLYIGDDVTDVDALQAIRAAREQGDDRSVAGLGIGVIGPDTPPGVLAATDVTVEGIDGVYQLLRGIADALEEMKP